MKKLVLTKDTIRDLSRPELEVVGGATYHGPICCDGSGGGGTGDTCSIPGCLCLTGTTCIA